MIDAAHTRGLSPRARGNPITLPSGRVATVRAPKGRDTIRAQRVADDKFFLDAASCSSSSSEGSGTRNRWRCRPMRSRCGSTKARRSRTSAGARYATRNAAGHREIGSVCARARPTARPCRRRASPRSSRASRPPADSVSLARAIRRVLPASGTSDAPVAPWPARPPAASPRRMRVPARARPGRARPRSRIRFRAVPGSRTAS